MRSLLVVGGSLAGLSTARALRAAGFDGDLTIVGDEEHEPYDRPPLSKGFLSGSTDVGGLALGSPADADLALRWQRGSRAVALDPTTLTVRLASGDELRGDGIVVATGAAPRRLLGTAGLAGVHTLRTLDDAIALRDDLAGRCRVVVIGAGFIGAEVASTARSLGHDVTVVDAQPRPLDAQLGPTVAAIARSLPADRGVALRTGVAIARVHGSGGRVASVELDDGTVLPADVLVVGIGVLPATQWLDGSGLECQDGVLTDARGITSHPRIAAVGDVARYPSARAGRRVRVEHWTNALEMPRTAAVALLAGSGAAAAPPVYDPVPYFWSDQYGVKIQAAGHFSTHDDLRVVDGDLDSRRFTVAYERGDRLVGVVSFSNPKSFTALRRELAENSPAQEVA